MSATPIGNLSDGATHGSRRWHAVVSRLIAAGETNLDHQRMTVFIPVLLTGWNSEKQKRPEGHAQRMTCRPICHREYTPRGQHQLGFCSTRRSVLSDVVRRAAAGRPTGDNKKSRRIARRQPTGLFARTSSANATLTRQNPQANPDAGANSRSYLRPHAKAKSKANQAAPKSSFQSLRVPFCVRPKAVWDVWRDVAQPAGRHSSANPAGADLCSMRDEVRIE